MEIELSGGQKQRVSITRKVSNRVLFVENGLIALEGNAQEVFDSDNQRLKDFLGKFEEEL